MFWFALVSLAMAAPFELPAGESPTVWARPLALAGLDLGAVGAGEGIRVVVSPSAWVLVARDEGGIERRVTVPPPHTPEAREEVAALAASLLHPVSRLSSLPLPPLPALPPAPDPQRPPPAIARSVPASAPVAAPEPVAPPEITYTERPPVIPAPSEPMAIAVDESLLPRTAPPPPLPRGDPRVAVARPGPLVWWSAGPEVVRLRARVATTASFGVWLGVALPSPVRVGLGLDAVLPATLRQLSVEGGPRRMWTTDARGLVAWAPGKWDLGATGGMSLRMFTDPVETAAPGPIAIPTVGLVAAVRLPVTSGFHLRVAVSLERDLVATDLWSATTVPAGRLPPTSGGLSISACGGGGDNRSIRGTAGRPETR